MRFCHHAEVPRGIGPDDIRPAVGMSGHKTNSLRQRRLAPLKKPAHGGVAL
jgi:hypothetical protein